MQELRKLRVQSSDFEVKDVIGRGHFGEVQVVRDKHTETVYAMKTLRKHETLMQLEVCLFIVAFHLDLCKVVDKFLRDFRF